MAPSTRDRLVTALACVLIVAATVVFLPGRSGPFIFDDYTNLHDNSYVKIKSLDPDSLYYAAFSLDSGPLRRPVAMASFAINYLFAGSLRDATPYKLANIGIHALSGVVLFFLVRLLWRRLVPQPHAVRNPAFGAVLIDVVPALLVALIWVVHPIQTMGVLYVIQRMNELSALFSLLALLLYLKGRLLMRTHRVQGLSVAALGFVTFGGLALFSKENALVLPVYVLLFELALLRDQAPWNLWQRLRPAQRRAILTLAGVACLAGTVAVVWYALPGYSTRQFTMSERVMTEARVLFFYLSLILVPRLNRFGHQHDDIALSATLIDPWTTLPAIVGHAVLIGISIWLVVRRRAAVVGFGVLWFYVGHLLESSIFALEIAHEHRNYLPSAGMFIAITGLWTLARRTDTVPIRWYAIVALFAVAYGIISFQRSGQFSDYNSFYRYEALHHPGSARIQAGLAILLQAQGDLRGAIDALRKAHAINPDEPGYLIQIALLTARQGHAPDPDLNAEIIRMLGQGPATATAFLAIQQITNCMQSWCASLQRPLEQWTTTILDRKGPKGDISYYHYALGLVLAAQGKVADAKMHLNRSWELDPIFLHPLFALASLQVQLGDADGAETSYRRIHAAHHNHRHPRPRELEALRNDIQKLRSRPTPGTYR